MDCVDGTGNGALPNEAVSNADPQHGTRKTIILSLPIACKARRITFHTYIIPALDRVELSNRAATVSGAILLIVDWRCVLILRGVVRLIYFRTVQHQHTISTFDTVAWHLFR